MGNLVGFLKKFLANKNTVTILGVVAGIIVLWGFYTYRVNEATTPTTIPCAKGVLEATDEITKDDITYIEVSASFLKNSDVITNANDLIGKYVATGTSIPQGAVFYSSQVVAKEDLPNTLFEGLEEGYTAYSLAVDNHSTFGNSIYPGDKIDLYMKATDEDGKLMYGLLIKSITVLGVRDSSGKDVFKLGSTSTPSELIFGVEDEMYELLKKAEFLSGITLVPVIRGGEYTEAGAEVKTVEYLKAFILSKTAIIQE